MSILCCLVWLPLSGPAVFALFFRFFFFRLLPVVPMFVYLISHDYHKCSQVFAIAHPSNPQYYIFKWCNINGLHSLAYLFIIICLPQARHQKFNSFSSRSDPVWTLSIHLLLFKYLWICWGHRCYMVWVYGWACLVWLREAPSSRIDLFPAIGCRSDFAFRNGLINLMAPVR